MTNEAEAVSSLVEQMERFGRAMDELCRQLVRACAPMLELAAAWPVITTQDRRRYAHWARHAGTPRSQFRRGRRR
jgi:isopenicillin N synthase-like dioxygenase